MLFTDVKNNKNHITVARDDIYPFLGGGNKGRKIDYIGKYILSKNYNAVVTTGGVQSNHCRAVAVFCAQNNIRCTLVIHGDKRDFEKKSGNALIMKASGADIKFAEDSSKIGPLMDDAINSYHADRLNPYYLQGGGHTNEGGLAYIEAIDELIDPLQQAPDYIFLASGTGSTQAGILTGLDKHQLPTKVVGISVGRNKQRAENIVQGFYHHLCKQYGISCMNKEVIVCDEYLCGGYGKYSDEIKNLSLNSIKKFGFTLDTTYTAKAFYGMEQYIIKNNISDKHILFWHTGGIFNFLA